MKSLRAFIYLLYLVAVVSLTLEICLRFGLFPSEAYRIEQSIAGMGQGRRVLILGDSFSVDLDDSFARLLQESLSARNFKTLNLARGGFGPAEYLSMLERYGVGFRPELVIVSTYVGNDTSDTAYRAARTRGPKEFAKRLMIRSYLGSLFFEIRVTMISRNRIAHVAKVQDKPGLNPGPVENPFLLELSWTHPDCFLTNLLMETPEALPAWEANQATLLELKRVVDSMNARFQLNILPDSVQVNESHHAFYRDMGFKLDPRMLSTSVPQDLLRQFCGDHQLKCLDLLPAFREQKDREFYKTRDSHWNAEGNQFAFEVVSRDMENP